MLNFDQIVRSAAQVAGDKPILAAPYPLSNNLCRGLTADGLICGYLADDRPNPDCRDPLIAGWWTDRTAGLWFIRYSRSPTMILLSATSEHEIGGRMLLEARLKGVRRILFVAPDGSIASEVNVETELMERLSASSDGYPIHALNYERALEEMYSLIGDRFRLPFAAFEAGRILIITGSLAAGGAERQAAYTAAGLAKRLPGQVYLARPHAGPTFDFFKPMVDAAGVDTRVMPEWADEYNSTEIMEIRNGLASQYIGLGFLSVFYMIYHHAALIREIRPQIVHAFQDYSNILRRTYSLRPCRCSAPLAERAFCCA